MAKSEEVYSFTAKQLFESRKNRDIIPLCLSADIALGGGIPLGCTAIIGGKPKSGKTTMALQYAAYAQQLYKVKVFFFSIEGRLDNKVLNQIRGLDLENVEVVVGEVISDKDGKIIQHKKMPAEWWWTKIGETIASNPRSVIIVDSISALSDEKELSEGMGYQSRGGLQKLEAQFIRQYGDLAVPSEVTLFLLAQIQANTGGYGEATQIKCGNAIKHAADCIIFAKGVEKWQGDRVLGHDIKCKVECSPLGAPYLDCDVPLRFGYGIDDIKDVVTHCVNWEVIKRAGAWYTMPFTNETEPKLINPDNTDDSITPLKLQGEDSIRNFLLVRPQQKAVLENIIRKKVLG